MVTNDRKQNVRGKQKLTIDQEAQIIRIQEVEAAYWSAKKSVRAKVEREVAKQLEEFLSARETAIYEAIEMGVPLRRIHTEGLGTANANYVYDVRKRFDAKREFAEASVPKRKGPRFSWGHVTIKIGNSGYAWVIDADEPEFESEGIVDRTTFVREYRDGHYVNIKDGRVQSTASVPDDVAAWAVEHLEELEDSILDGDAEPEEKPKPFAYEFSEDDGREDWG